MRMTLFIVNAYYFVKHLKQSIRIELIERPTPSFLLLFETSIYSYNG